MLNHQNMDFNIKIWYFFYLLLTQMYTGIIVTILITFFWVGATQCFYFLYASPKRHESLLKALGLSHLTLMLTSEGDTTSSASANDTTKQSKPEDNEVKFQAPFIASWFTTNFLIVFFPAYLIFRGIARKCGANTETFGDILRGFRERGYTFGRYFYRCISFCLLWVGSTYLYMKSLRVLNATEVIVLFATNVSSVYLLSWVILHEQFVGIRVSVSKILK
jgi:solute carrier family 35, member F3/4